METTTLKIALAALFHDVGKLAQDGLEISREYQQNNIDLYQPFNREKKYHSHRHALYTAAFIEQMAEYLPAELNAASWGDDNESFINLAARHHKPETVLETIVSQADRISSGLERAHFAEGEEIGVREYRTTRMLPLFEQLDPGRETPVTALDKFAWEYRLEPLSSTSIFPQKRITRAKEEAKKEYHALYEAFVEGLKNLKNRNNPRLWMEHFTSLLQSFTAMIPQARVGYVVPDVSLYDHARTTSALAAALYIWHRAKKSLNEHSIHRGDAEKFLLIGGDFYGIQNFIFSSGGETAASRSKLLRGRSFYVSFFSDLCADLLCRTLGLPSTAVVLNAAGKFTLIAANTDDAAAEIEKVRREINQWLYINSFGTSSYGITVTSARQEEFSAEKFALLWARHKRDMEETKTARLDLAQYGGVVPEKHYLSLFIKGADDGEQRDRLCPFCGIRPADGNCRHQEGRYSCGLCADQIDIGTQLVKKKLLAVFKGDTEGELHTPLPGGYQLRFCKEDEAENLGSRLIKLQQFNAADDGLAVSPVTGRWLNGYVPICSEFDLKDPRLTAVARRQEDLDQLRQGANDGHPKTFSDLACLAQHTDADHLIHGTAALGILKADVDQLGLLMGCGLPEERYTVSRMATLSRQLDSFFSLYLPQLLGSDERFHSVYTIFAGGDDLFLLGPWNRMRELALCLRDAFQIFVCENKEIHFSAGIAMAKGHTPVSRLADRAEEALERAKDAGGNRITLFGRTICWQQLEKLVDCEKEMERWRESYVSASLFYRLNEFIDMAEKEKSLGTGDVSFTDMHCLRWRAMFQYQMVRNLKKELKGEARKRALEEMQQFVTWLDNFGGDLRIPLWTVLYNRR